MCEIKPGSLLKIKTNKHRYIFSFNEDGQLEVSNFTKLTSDSPPIMFVAKEISTNPYITSSKITLYTFLHNGCLWWLVTNIHSKKLEETFDIVTDKKIKNFGRHQKIFY